MARSNGRIAPAARALGVHRNTVLYRLRAASAERGLDPRRPEDALRILAEAERRRLLIGLCILHKEIGPQRTARSAHLPAAGPLDR